jgi:hypothetical protein
MSAPFVGDGMQSLATLWGSGCRDKTPRGGYCSGMTDVNAARASLPDDTRSQILNAEVARWAQRGWTVETVAAGQAVLSKNKRIGWFWNLILVIITGGLWLIYVVYRALNRKKLTAIITVDPYGNVRSAG